MTYANTERNSVVLEQLIDLLLRRTPITDESEYPLVDSQALDLCLS